MDQGFRQIKVGDRVEITLKRIKDVKKYFTSQVVGVFENEKKQSFSMYSPISLGKTIFLPPGEVYTFVFYTTHMPVSCDGVTLKHYKEEEIYHTLSEVVSPFVKTQRRNFFRYDCILPLKYSVLHEDESYMHKNEDRMEGTIRNISAGGLRFAGNKELERGTTLQLIIELDGQIVMAEGRVLNCQRIIGKDVVFKFDTSVKFSTITRIEQEIILKYVFEGQRKLLQKNNSSIR